MKGHQEKKMICQLLFFDSLRVKIESSLLL